MNSNTNDQIRESIRTYYSRLDGTADLKTDACCTMDAPPPHIKQALSKIASAVRETYYGCGIVAPQFVGGEMVLDLGCGNGHDVNLAAQFVGEQGHVYGLDMLDKHLEVANKHKDYHAQQFGYQQSNTTFVKGHIELLEEAGVKDQSLDVVISNCVINLSPQKSLVLNEVYRALKQGGEFYFSDVYADRRLPSAMMDDPELLGECLSGALYWGDAIDLFKQTGFTDPRLVTSRRLNIENEELQQRIVSYAGDVKFYSATYRLFKTPNLEQRCEDYGQAVVYQGGIPYAEHLFALDGHHRIEKGRMFAVCGNTFNMLKYSRFSQYFEFYGDVSQHFGIFPDCGDLMPYSESEEEGGKNVGAVACC